LFINDPFFRSSYLIVHKRNDEICFRDMPTTYIVFGLIEINPIYDINKLSLRMGLNIENSK